MLIQDYLCAVSCNPRGSFLYLLLFGLWDFNYHYFTQTEGAEMFLYEPVCWTKCWWAAEVYALKIKHYEHFVLENCTSRIFQLCKIPLYEVVKAQCSSFVSSSCKKRMTSRRLLDFCSPSYLLSCPPIRGSVFKSAWDFCCRGRFNLSSLIKSHRSDYILFFFFKKKNRALRNHVSVNITLFLLFS